MSNSSIQKAYQQFNQAFNVAINKGYIMKNTMVDVTRPHSVKEDKVVRALTVDEQQAFTNYLLNKDYLRLNRTEFLFCSEQNWSMHKAQSYSDFFLDSM